MLSEQRRSVLHHYFTKFWPLPVTPNSFNAPNRCLVLWSEPFSHEWQFRQVCHQSTVCGEQWYRRCYPTDPLHYWLDDHLTNVLPSFRGTWFFSSLLNHFSIVQHYQKIMQGFTGKSHKPLQTRDFVDLLRGRCHAPNRFGTVDIGITSPAFRKLKSFFKNIFMGLKHLELRKRKIADVIPRAGYNKFKKDSDANNMTVQQYYHETYNIHIK